MKENIYNEYIMKPINFINLKKTKTIKDKTTASYNFSNIFDILYFDLFLGMHI